MTAASSRAGMTAATLAGATFLVGGGGAGLTRQKPPRNNSR